MTLSQPPHDLPGDVADMDPAALRDHLRALDWPGRFNIALAMGWSMSHLARAIGFSPASVHQAACRHGFVLRNGRADNGRHVRLTLTNFARIDRLRLLASQGATMAEAADEEGMHVPNLHLVAKREGIRFRRHGEHIADFLALPEAAR